ncbi:hypothetical protein AB6D66_25260 [Vibrio pomeroyi]|uniref:Uncharacterized protein n=1 Tax=Vibrio pomeroyi TaxID=198832 RepID=A0ABV4N4N8_9VIBR
MARISELTTRSILALTPKISVFQISLKWTTNLMSNIILESGESAK